MANKIEIGFIGGCINNQKGLTRKAHYYSILNHKLNPLGINNHLLLGSYKSINTLVESLNTMLQKGDPSIIGVFIRPFTIMPLYKPFIRYETKAGKEKWGIHPYFYGKSANWQPRLTDDYVEREYRYVAKNKIGLRDVNLWIGKILGLSGWADRYLVDKIDELEQICRSKSIELIIISPPRNPESTMGDNICKKLALSLKNHCDNHNLNYINLSQLKQNVFDQDNLHFNATGHQILGDMLFKTVEDMMGRQTFGQT